AESLPQLIADLRSTGMRGRVLHTERGRIPMELLFFGELHTPSDAQPIRRRPTADRFETLSWTNDRPISLPAFQGMIERLTPGLVRAKGIFSLADQPDRSLLFQLTNQRATLAAGPAPQPGQPPARLVLIFEVGSLDPDVVRRELRRCVT